MAAEARQRWPYLLLDVFTDRPFGGNALAVFELAHGLPAAAMQALARELNLAESVFVLPAQRPTALRRLRIFTPAAEMPFAGHPTIGAAFALAHWGALPGDEPEAVFTLELNLGLMPMRLQAGRFAWLELPPAQFGPPLEQPEQAARALGLEPGDLALEVGPVQIAGAGVPYLVVPLRSLDALRRAQPGSPELRSFLGRAGAAEPMPVCAYLFTLEAESPGHAAQARMFSPDPGDLPEDAATGSAAGPLGAYLWRHDAAGSGRLIIEQGNVMGRPSLIHVEPRPAGRLAIGGQAVIVGEGALCWP